MRQSRVSSDVSAVTVVFLALAVAGRPLQSLTRYGMTVTAAAGVVVVLLSLSGTSRGRALPVVVLLAANWAPVVLYKAFGLSIETVERLIAIVPGIGEALSARRYLDWVRRLQMRTVVPATAWGPIAATAPGAPVVQECARSGTC